MSYDFIINHSDKKTNARQGTIKTPNGNIETPAFIFCATHGTIKGLTSDQMKLCKTQIVLSNTYHLEVFPGSKRIKEMGGLHKCMNWKGPILTDSGGYQIFAMGHGSVSKEIKGSKTHTFTPTLKKISDNGAEFISYRDKSKIVLTPEKSIQIQRDLGTNFVVCFDERV
jgi:queuine tRNA-ribosyltransferase